MATAFQETATDRTRYYRASRIDWLVKGLLAPHVEADIAMKEKALARLRHPTPERDGPPEELVHVVLADAVTM